MCEKSGEFIDNLLHCEVARDLWSSLFNLFGFDWVMSRRVKSCWRVGEARWGVVTFWKFGGWFRCVKYGLFGEDGRKC
jgi:hypothetical protein